MRWRCDSKNNRRKFVPCPKFVSRFWPATAATPLGAQRCPLLSFSSSFFASEKMSDGNPPGPLRGDIGTSYPSPISSAGSPNLEETSRQVGAETQSQGRPDTQHSLRAASAALQAAYRRIRQGPSPTSAFLFRSSPYTGFSPTKPGRIGGATPSFPH